MAVLGVKHILVAHRYEADDLLSKIKADPQSTEKTFIKLAEKFSKCSSRKIGGDLGLVADRRLDPDFAEAASHLKPGQVSEPIRTRFGYHLILRYQ